jgi:hypothetical protein
MLGPSEGLVRKHADRLPVGHYELAARTLRIPVKGITPSNQLSYVARIDAHGQRILVTGDAGMVDFRRGPRQWHGRLLDELRGMHVIQVAHHAGRNGHFYHALLAAAGDAGVRDELLLVSHATRDRHRPSDEFRAFLESRAGTATPRLLFTSMPTAERVRGFTSAIHPPVGEPAQVGDVALAFSDGRWLVRAHAVDVG